MCKRLIGQDVNKNLKRSVKMNVRFRIKRLVVVNISVWCIVFGMIWFNLFYSYNDVQLKCYQTHYTKLSGSLNVLLLGDLHDYEFDDNNAELVKLNIEQHPDIILMIGDMMNSYSYDAEKVIDFIENIRTIAPVYYALGNHELEWMNFHDEDLIAQLESAGAIVLNREYCDIEIEGQKIRIGGLYDYAFSLQNLDSTDTTNEKVQVYNFLREFEDTDAFKIMLSHRPDSFIFGDASKAWDIDLVASGHLHGGQVVLPFLGGVYGGDQGWFPEYVHGLYEKDDMSILVTSGLSTNKKSVPRWNNPPEIVVLELLPQ